jgi:hypothetical protein
VTDSSSAPDQQSSPDIDASVPHSARVWNYWLGGKDYFPADQQAGDQFREVFPESSTPPAAPGAFSRVRCAT